MLRLCFIVVAALALSPCYGGDMSVTSVSPSGLTADVASSVRVTFDRAVDRGTVDERSFWAFGRWSGVASGTFSFEDGDQTVVLTPDFPFSAGEQVMVIVSHDVMGTDGVPLRSAGYSWQFWTAARPAPLAFTLIQDQTTRTVQSETSRAYGGIASDLNHDRVLDLTIVNEDTADLRVFMNKADGSGTFDPFTQPTFPVGDRASPSEPSDFNFDGHTDICVANINPGTVSFLMGNGDGTYAPQTSVFVGAAPRGICVLDADGDGDADVVSTHAIASVVAIHINDGAGNFAAPVTMDAGFTSEWALAAADMNEDGILDLIVGSQNQQRVVVLLGNGDGTFAPQTPVLCGGRVWMIATGDVNNDGHVDICCGNGSANNGSILFGDGNGSFGPAQTYPTDPFTLATDFGDFDGDGDLDWITSSYQGDWRLFVNDGTGSFAFEREFNAPSAASCSLAADVDNDGDVDIVLVDEIADRVIVMRTGCPADFTGDDDLNTQDFVAYLNAFNAGDIAADRAAPWGILNSADVLGFLNQFVAGCPL